MCAEVLSFLLLSSKCVFVSFVTCVDACECKRHQTHGYLSLPFLAGVW